MRRRRIRHVARRRARRRIALENFPLGLRIEFARRNGILTTNTYFWHESARYTRHRLLWLRRVSRLLSMDARPRTRRMPSTFAPRVFKCGGVWICATAEMCLRVTYGACALTNGPSNEWERWDCRVSGKSYFTDTRCCKTNDNRFFLSCDFALAIMRTRPCGAILCFVRLANLPCETLSH